jgi:tRNA (cytidine/uridine-2'-O-)-methyltransferase
MSKLHIVGETGFSMEDKYLKRAGLDYWPKLNFEKYDTWDDFITKNKPQRLFLFSAHSETLYSSALFKKNDFLVFGSETKGLDMEIKNHPNAENLKIPQSSKVRCFNLSNSVAIGLFEALRQNNYSGLI